MVMASLEIKDLKISEGGDVSLAKTVPVIPSMPMPAGRPAGAVRHGPHGRGCNGCAAGIV